MIPLNRPSITALEEQYVLEALRSGWITTGEFVHRLEAEFAAWLGVRHAITCSSGSVALWLALRALELRPGRVAVPAYTCDAVGNAAALATGAVPLVVDIENDTWGLDAARLREAMATQLSPVRAVVLVHTYGVPSRDTEAVCDACVSAKAVLVEDCSEAHGAELNGSKVGRFGHVAVFSCRGEKILGAGQLGVVTTDDDALAMRVRQYARNGLPTPTLRYWSTRIGLNFEASNLLAALGLAQLHRIDGLIAARRAVHAGWRRALGDLEGIAFQRAVGVPVWWLTAIRLSEAFTWLDPRDLATALAEREIETRPAFYPLNRMPSFAGGALDCPVAESLLRQLLILPSGVDITPDDQQRVRAALLWITGRT